MKLLLSFITATGIAIHAPAQSTAQPRAVALHDLTVPPDRLPAGCALAPAPAEPLDQRRVRVGLWGGFPSNPWSGSDRQLIASMRYLFQAPPAEPDGPPMNAAERARYQTHLADGIEEGYAAVYADREARLIAVRAVRFTPSEVPQLDARTGGNPFRIMIGPIAASVTGESGACLDAVRQHLQSLAKGPR